MRFYSILGLMLPALLTLGTSSAAAQCGPQDQNGDHLIRIVNQYANPADSAWRAARDGLGIGIPGSTGMVQITKGGACKSANTAYQKKARGNRATLSGQVYVVQSGNTYIVWDPKYRFAAGSSDTYMVFDANWVFKKGFQ